MKSDWKSLERHPLSEEYPNITGPAWERFVRGIQECGILPTNSGQARKVTLYENKIVDGFQLYRACVETDIKPEFKELKLPKGVTIEQWVEVVNDNRRHEAADVTARRATERRKRVAKALEEGKSERQIAADEGVSRAQIQRDKEDIQAGGGPGGPPAEKHQKPTGKVESARSVLQSAKPPKPSKKRTLKQAVEAETGETLTDELDQPVPPGLAPVFRGATVFKGILSQFKEIKAAARNLAEQPAGRRFHLQQFESDLDNARRTVRFDMPYAVCTVCKGSAKTRRANCPCKDTGWLNESSYNALPGEHKK